MGREEVISQTNSRFVYLCEIVRKTQSKRQGLFGNLVVKKELYCPGLFDRKLSKPISYKFLNTLFLGYLNTAGLI